MEIESDNDTDVESVGSLDSVDNQLNFTDYMESILNQDWTDKNIRNTYYEIFKALKLSIESNNGKGKDSEYYFCLLSLLKCTDIDADKLIVYTSILKHLVSKVTSAEIHASGDYLSKVSLDMLEDEKYGKYDILIINAIKCMSKWLACLSLSEWKLDNTRHCYCILFRYTNDQRDSINKTARNEVISIFVRQQERGNLNDRHPLVKATVLLLNNTLTQRSSGSYHNKKLSSVKESPEDVKLILCLSTLEKLLLTECLNNEIVVSFTETMIKRIYSLQTVSVQCKIFDIFTQLFQCKILTPEYIAKSMSFLFDFMKCTCGIDNSSSNIKDGIIYPTPTTEIYESWLRALIIGFESLVLQEETTFTVNGETRECRAIALLNATHIVRVCTDWLLSDNNRVQSVAYDALEKLSTGSLFSIEKTDYVDYLCPDKYAGDCGKWLTSWLNLITRHLKVENVILWQRLFSCVTNLIVRSQGRFVDSFFEQLRTALPYASTVRDRFEDIIDSLLVEGANTKKELKDEDRSLKSIINHTFGACIQWYGVERVLSVVPLRIVEPLADGKVNISVRRWLLWLLPKYVQGTTLNNFSIYILPVIRETTMEIRRVQKEDNTVNNYVNYLYGLQDDMWKCMPSFCNGAKVGSLREVTATILQPHQMPYPITTNDGNVQCNLFQLMVNLLDPTNESHLENVVLNSIKMLIKTAEDKEEMRQTLTSSTFYPVVVKHCFNWILREDCSCQITIRSLLDCYMPLFPPGTFIPNCNFIINNKLNDLNPLKPKREQLVCFDLLNVVVPHLPTETIEQVFGVLEKFLVENVSDKVQAKVYRFLSIITSSETDSSVEFTKKNMAELLIKLAGWKNVKSDSWKCRVKTLKNLFQLLNNVEEVRQFLNTFVSELIMCLCDKNLKTRSNSGFLIVEGIINCYEFSDETEASLSASVDKMLQHFIGLLQSKLTDTSKQGVLFKNSLAKGIVLLVSENRLSRVVSEQQIENVCSLVTGILGNHVEPKGGNVDRNLVYNGLNIIKGLLKKKTGNFDKIQLEDIGNCIKAASPELLGKVRLAVKKIIKCMLKLWDYEDVKKNVPEVLVGVVRNIHKAMNRSRRKNDAEKDADEDMQSQAATSWIGGSQAGSNKTMKNPHMKNVAEILRDSDDEDDDLVSRITGMTMKTSKSSASVASKKDIRRLRKQKILKANLVLPLGEDEEDGEVMDLMDPLSRNIRKAKRRVTIDENALNNDSSTKENIKNHMEFKYVNGQIVIGDDLNDEEGNKNKDKSHMGFKYVNGKIVIGDDLDKNNEEDSDGDNKKDKKNERFVPRHKRAKREHIPGSEYKSKKGVMGDMTRKGAPKPYAMINSSQINSNVLSKYNRQHSKKLKQARKGRK